MGGYTYDTAAIRREASKFKRCCECIENAALPRVKDAGAKLDGGFEGRAADALRVRLLETQTRLNDLRDGCGNIYAALMRYADALEAADARVSQMMGR